MNTTVTNASGRKAGLPPRPSLDSTSSSVYGGGFGSQDFGRGSGLGSQNFGRGAPPPQQIYGSEDYGRSIGQAQQTTGGYGQEMSPPPLPPPRVNGGGLPSGPGSRKNNGQTSRGWSQPGSQDSVMSRPGVAGQVGAIRSETMQTPSPNPKLVLNGYQRDIENNFEGEKPRFNPMNTSHPQSSQLLNVNDPIQVHLLVETALGDSKEFEVLSPEEVDDLKKQISTLTQRIAQTKQNLTIQAKMRGAAMSIAKLYSNNKSPEGPERKQRRSLLGSRGSNNSDSISQAEQERLASEKKSEELATELWALERRLMEPQKRLLQHTAGILQMTHKGPAKVQKPNGMMQPGISGIPGSPESMYTYSNARSSMEPASLEDDPFDERSLYRMFDRVEGGLGFTTNRDSWEGSSKLTEHLKTIAQSEEKMGKINDRLRSVLVQGNSQREQHFSPPSSQKQTNAVPGKLLNSHLEYLEKSLDLLDKDYRKLKQAKDEESMAMEETIEELNREIRDILLPFDPERPIPPNLTGTSLGQQLNYLQNSMGAIENELQHAATTSTDNKAFAAQQSSIDEMEAVFTGLWDIIQSNEADTRVRKIQRRQIRARNPSLNDDNSSGDELSQPSSPTPFSFQAFSSRVQLLITQTSGLAEQKKVLQRQIKQQRDLNSKGEGEKNTQITQLTASLNKTQLELSTSEREAREVQGQLQQVMERLDEARKTNTQREMEKSRKDTDGVAAMAALEGQLLEKKKRITELEDRVQEAEDEARIGDVELKSELTTATANAAEMNRKLADAQARIASLSEEIRVAEGRARDAEGASNTELERLKSGIKKREEEVEGLNMEMARLQTEVTIARAELDGAYGSRAERAKEVAANPAVVKEMEALGQRNRILEGEIEELKEQLKSNSTAFSSGSAAGGDSATIAELKKELGETIEEYEVLTRAGVEWEREREGLEHEVDKLREEREGLEQRLGDEKVRWLGMKSPLGSGAGSNAGDGVGMGMTGSAATATSTKVLKEEFKKMMRDTRAESARVLRIELAERRRLEEELRSLKKAKVAHGPGKSSLSLSQSASSQ